jgi:hypothetical protein
MRWFLFLSLLPWTGILPAFSQNPYPQGYFLNPLDIPISLSGNFGEIRNNHFHSGLDLRTGGKEGLPVFASAGGYVSRIKVSPFGYGKAVYITHENGFVSVYAHLSSFDSTLGAWIRQKQYEKQTFELDLFPEKNQFVFSQCDTIGFSGNSGGSEGPHLHFEIREEKSEKPVNPLLFGLPVEDTLAPVIASILVSPAEEGTTVNGQLTPLRLPVKRLMPGDSLLSLYTDTVSSEGMLLFALEVWDCEVNPDSKNGVYELSMTADGSVCYASRLEKFAFDQTKYVNAHINYRERKVGKRNYIRTHFLPNNKAGVYLPAERGYSSAPEPGTTRIVEFKASDVFGRQTSVLLPWKGINMPQGLSVPTNVEGDTLSDSLSGVGAGKEWAWNKDQSFESKDFKISITAGSLYDNILFQYRKLKPVKGARSAVYQIFREDVPLHKAAWVEIKSNPIPAGLHAKVVLAKLDRKGRAQTAVPTTHEKNRFKAKISQFGKYALMLDTIAPKIIQKDVVKGKPNLKDGSLEFSLSDNLSGIDQYRGSIDGKWVLMDYDAKSGTLRYDFDEHLEKTGKKHKIQISVSDHAGNKTLRSFDFVY